LLLQNPAFFWRRCFVIVIFAMIGHLTLDYYVVLDTSQGLQNLNFLWRAGNETEVKSETLLFQSIPYLVAMFLCAFMDYKLRCED
ncbi:hypothetical protein, partial [Roseibium sp.]|uniref:hypothetical protein n=1 Tax=Roseibium sp. TaxID=1936156 RepID=UPI003514E900